MLGDESEVSTKGLLTNETEQTKRQSIYWKTRGSLGEESSAKQIQVQGQVVFFDIKNCIPDGVTVNQYYYKKGSRNIARKSQKKAVGKLFPLSSGQ